ncbi:MAG TPA: hypothetical protein VNT75_05445, partial [Symbiobacteriaceae bacterium]|nr:hypothetical protein [Symbiobacteriaceae bacterium]
MRTAFGRQLKALRAGLSASPDALPLTHLRPVFVPAAFMEAGNWPGPYELCDIPGLALTWAVLLPQQTMRYVSHETAAHWEANGTPWRERALQNLLLSAGEQPFTHELRRDDSSVYAVIMMHEDGLG